MIHEVPRKKDDLSTLDPRQDPQAATRAGKMTVPNEAKAGPNDPNEASRVDGDLGPFNLGSTPRSTSCHARRRDDDAQRSKGRSKRPKRSVARRRRPRTSQPWIHAKIHKLPRAQARGRCPTKQRQVQTTQTKRRASTATSDLSTLDPRQDPQAATRAGKMTVPNEAKAGPNDPNEASRVDGDLGPFNLGSTPRSTSCHARRRDDDAQRSKGRSKRPKRSVARRRRPRTSQPWIHAKIHKLPRAQAR